MPGKEWGYPQGSLRPVPSSEKAFSVIHITGNADLPSAEGEATWRNNDAANQNSATFFVNRDGTCVQFLSDPLHMDPWSNGDVNEPDMSNARIASAVRDNVNMNERTLVAIENVGFEPAHPITDAQAQTCAEIIAHYHKAAGVPIKREAVVGHYQINSVTRPNCPARDKSLLDDIVKRAQALGEDPMAIAELEKELAECKATAAKRWRRIVAMTQRQAALLRQVEDLQAMMDAAGTGATLEQLKTRVGVLSRKLTDVKQKVADFAEDVADG
jgi:hypothetical protein